MITMRILFFTDTLDVGGKERRLTELMKSLLRRNDIEFELVVMSEAIHYREILELDINIHYITRKTRHDLSIFKRFYDLCKSRRPDIIHCWDSMTAIYLVPVCKLLKIKLINGMVVDAPSKQNISNKYYLRARLTFPFSDVIIGNSEAGLKAYRAPAEKSMVIYNGFDFRRTENLTGSNDISAAISAGTKFTIGMVASFGPYKDYQTFYRAGCMLIEAGHDITFVAIGNRTDSSESWSLIDKKYAGSFRLLGRKSNPESYVNSMDICVLATYTEGISNSIMEYMALGRPVIATDGGGTKEIVVDGETGFLVEQSKPEQIAEKISVLLNDPDLRTRMGEKGRARVAEIFSIDRMTGKYVDLYLSL
jgi:glycosyltransferase involved in cell wall biosynthesis